jgi:hypothetical protein
VISQPIGVPVASRVSMMPLAMIAMPATTSGSRGPLVPTVRPDSGAHATIIAATGSMYNPARSAE